MVLTDNLVGVAQNFVSPDFVEKFSGLLGEPVDKTRTGLKSAIPALLLGILNKVSTNEGAQSIVSMARSRATDDVTASDVNESTLGEGKEVVKGIFGNNLNSVVSKIGSNSGMNTSTINKMLGLAAPLIMGLLGSKIQKEGMNATGLMSFFKKQKASLTSSMPEGISSKYSTSINGISETIARPLPRGTGVYLPKSQATAYAWVPLALAVLAVLAGLWWFATITEESGIYDPRSQISSPQNEVRSQRDRID